MQEERRPLIQRVHDMHTAFADGGKVTRSELEQLLAETVTDLISLECEVNHLDEAVAAFKAAQSVAFATRLDGAAKTLSYSEIQGMQAIAPELTDGGGLIVASKIADRAGVTRSVILNALRKYESAGAIQTRSLGMKGTHIKPLIPGWADRYLAA